MHRPKILTSRADIELGVAALSTTCQHLRVLHAMTGTPGLRRRRRGFPGLARIITEQQLSTASAAAIWSRVEALATPFTAEAILKLSPQDLKQAGLSSSKISTLLGLAERISNNRLQLRALDRATPETVRETLIAVPGIGPWSADIYALFCLGFADAFAPGDLALQTAAQLAFDLEKRPSARDLGTLAEPWRPWRGVAARILWSSYRTLKNNAKSLS